MAIESNRPIYRYLTVGALVNVFGYALFIFIIDAGIGPYFASSISYPVSILLSFFLNRIFVFQSSQPVVKSLFLYVLMVTLGYVLNIAVIYIFHQLLKFKIAYVQIGAVVFATIFFYAFNKIYVHPRK